MATVRYFLQSKHNPAPIYCRLSSGNVNFKRRTGLLIDPERWNEKDGCPKNNEADGKTVNLQLVRLRTRIFEDLNEAPELSGAWLQNSIDRFFERVDTSNSLNYITGYAKAYAKRLENQRNKAGGRGAAKPTIVKYRTIAKKLAAFDKHKGKQHLFTDMNLDLKDQLVDYFIDDEKLSENYAGRLIKFVKTIARDARNNGIKVAPQIDEWQGFTVKSEKVILRLEEIAAIETQRFTSDSMEAAKDWLVISCFTGQRVSDLLRMNRGMIETHSDSETEQIFSLINLTQQKTKKMVSIPVHEKVQAILDKRGGEFPPSFGKKIGSAKAIYNRLIKKVAKAAGLDEPTKGRLKDESGEKLTAQGVFPKWMLVSSHIGRRSFASNFYAKKKYPTPLLMEITAHSTERQFLDYIGQKPIEKSVALARIWAEEAAARTEKKAGIVKSIVL